MIIFLSIIIIISILFNIKLIKDKIVMHLLIQEYEKYYNQISFLHGADMNPDFVIKEYKNAILITNYIEGGNETITVWDVSQYEKNRIVGLTTFGPSQMVDEGLKRAMERQPELFAGLDEDGIKELRQQLSDKVASEPLICYNVDIYQMKDGTWLWR